MSTPLAICRSTTWRTALSLCRLSSARSTGSPASSRIRRSVSTALRGRLPTCVTRMRSSLRRMVKFPSLLAQRPGEADVVPGQPVEHDLDTARLHHPFQTMIAIFAADRSRGEARRGIAHALGGSLELAEGRGDRRPLADAVAPLVQRRSCRRAEAIVERAVDVGRHAEVGPAEAGAVEPLGVAQSVDEP